MTFRTVDELLERQVAGQARPVAAERLDVRLVCFGRGVAVCEMSIAGEPAAGVLTTLAEAAMRAAATSTVADGRDDLPFAREIGGRFHMAPEGLGPVPVRAEAVVIRSAPNSLQVEAEVHADGTRIATFEAAYARGPGAAVDAEERVLAEQPLAAA